MDAYTKNKKDEKPSTETVIGSVPESVTPSAHNRAILQKSLE